MSRVSAKGRETTQTHIALDPGLELFRLPVGVARAVSKFLDDLNVPGPRSRKTPDAILDLAEDLKSLRIEADGGDGGARNEVATIRAEIDARASHDAFHFAGLMMVASLLLQAGVAIGDALPAATGRLVAAASGAQASGDLLAIFHEKAVLSLMDEAQDWVEVWDAANMAVAVFPADLKCKLVGMVTGDAEPDRAALAIGFMLHREDEPALAAIRGLAGRSDLKARDRQRIATIRPWLSPARRTAADVAFGTLPTASLWRSAGVVAGRKFEFIASLADGSGTSGLYTTLSHGRRHACVAIMIKPSGIAEVEVLQNLRHQEVRGFIGVVTQAAPAGKVDAATFVRFLRFALGENLASGTPPPLALLQALEVLGLESICPATTSVAELLDDLLADQCDRDEPAVVAAAQSDAGVLDFADVWLCAMTDVEAIAKGARGPKQLAGRVLTLLPRQSGFWMRNCALSAAVLKACRTPCWKSLALVGRDIARGVAPAEMPMMCHIADVSARAYWDIRPRPAKKRAV